MSGTDPGPTGDAAGDRRGASPWWWAVLAVLVLAGLALLVLQPWQGIETEPPLPPTPAPTASSTATAPESPSPPPTPGLPGTEAAFDDGSLGALFVTPATLVAQVPAAATGVTPGIVSGQVAWGLPTGSTVDPPTCVTAATVVTSTPAAFDARSWTATGFEFAQSVVVSATPADAQAAFRSLVTTIDGCPTYTVAQPGLAPDTWHTQPAIEGQGSFPSIVQKVTHGSDVPAFHGQMLVGNAIVTWTASATGGGDPDAALATLGDALSLAAMVQDQAQTAVDSLG